jgi:TetR/AcrR family transcriptional regulator, transcriptional repressor of bet genes
MARPTNTAERRGQIISALAQVMAKQGYDGASVADVARAAKLTPGLVHYHFKSKQEILLALLQDLSERHLSKLDARLQAVAGDARAQLAAFIDFHLGLGAEADPQALACWILLSGEALRQAKVRTRFEKTLAALVERLAGLLQAGVQSGCFDCESVPAAASALVATMQGYFVLAATARALIPRGSAATMTKQMAEGLLR